MKGASHPTVLGAGAPSVDVSRRVDPVILREYDVRGIVGNGLDAGIVYELGRAIGSEAAVHAQREVVVGRDGRLSSDELAQALIRGLRASGRDVIDLGRVPTPVMNFATFHLGTGAGVMVTGSHNPADYNGLKIVVGGQTLSGEAIRNLGRRVDRQDYIAGNGGCRAQDVVPAYIDRIVAEIELARPLKIVLDAGNGVAGAVAPQLFRALGCAVDELFCEVDGRFPNHHPDPTVPANLAALIERVRRRQADIGLAFDGDGDRLGVVDNAGNIIWADRQLMLFARDVLARVGPGASVVFDVKCSAGLPRLIREHGGVPVMWKTGHSLIKSKVKETAAPLGGELSGHIFFNDTWYGFDDALYAGARLLSILAARGVSAAELFAELPNAVSTPELRLDLSPGQPEALMRRLMSRLQSGFKGAELITIDGLRADFDHGWGLVRASNTTPSLVFRFEADDEAALLRLKEQFRVKLLEIEPGLALPF